MRQAQRAMEAVHALGSSAAMSHGRFIASSVLLLGCGLAEAGTLSSATPSEPAARAAPAVSMDQAVKLTERRFHARVVKAETEQGDGRTVYVLRLLDEVGRVWTVRVDAASGAVL